MRREAEIPARALAHFNGEQPAVILEICLVFSGHVEAPEQAYLCPGIDNPTSCMNLSHWKGVLLKLHADCCQTYRFLPVNEVAAKPYLGEYRSYEIFSGQQHGFLRRLLYRVKPATKGWGVS